MIQFPENPKKILVRSTNWIGDAVMTNACPAGYSRGIS